MDRRIIIVFLLIIIAILSAIVVNTFTDKEVTKPISVITPDNPQKTQEEKVVEVTPEMTENIKNDSYLDILVQIKAFDNLNVSYEPLLEAAMRIASQQNLLQEPEDGIYFEYVPKNIVHDIIYELSGIRITDPIIIEDFYYLYNEENDYYYIVPIGANWLELKRVNSISYTQDGDQYVVKCIATGGSEDFDEVETYPNMEVRLKYKPSNTYIKYQLISIFPGKAE